MFSLGCKTQPRKVQPRKVIVNNVELLFQTESESQNLYKTQNMARRIIFLEAKIF